MTKKVAIGQAFRLCFSDDLGGLPYEEAEMPNNVTEETPLYLPTENTTPHEDNESNQNVPPYDGNKEEIGREIDKILETKDSNGLPYFRDIEAKQERDKFTAGDLQAANQQLERLKKYLITREARSKSLPNTTNHNTQSNPSATDEYDGITF
jgi:hypothetical protein